jgi:hypothetical protein
VKVKSKQTLLSRTCGPASTSEKKRAAQSTFKRCAVAKKQEAKATRGSASRKCESPELKLQVIEDCRPENSFL